jgi:hypothetical protein
VSFEIIEPVDHLPLDRAYFDKRVRRLYQEDLIHFYSVPSTPKWLVTTLLQLINMPYEAPITEDDFKDLLDNAKSLHVAVLSDPDKSLTELTREAVAQIKSDVHPENEDYQCIQILQDKDDLPELEEYDDSLKILFEFVQEGVIQNGGAYCPTGNNTVYLLIASV